MASALDSAAAGGGGGESWKQKYEKKKKEYEKLQKSYQKVNQENAAMKSKIEKVVSKEIKAVEVDTADLYSNGQQAFIVSHWYRCDKSELWTSVWKQFYWQWVMGMMGWVVEVFLVDSEISSR